MVSQIADRVPHKEGETAIIRQPTIRPWPSRSRIRTGINVSLVVVFNERNVCKQDLHVLHPRIKESPGDSAPPLRSGSRSCARSEPTGAHLSRGDAFPLDRQDNAPALPIRLRLLW